MTVFCLFVFLLVTVPQDWRIVRGPLLLLGALGLIMLAQLIPLPPGLWRALPGRERFLPGLALAGAQHAWLPISVAPDRTWDSLVGLLVPATALFGYAAIAPRYRAWTLAGILVLGGASACLGVAQLASGSTAVLSYSRIDQGFPVGLFANKNHQSVLLVCMLPLLRAWSLDGQRRRVREMVAAAVGVAILPAILVTGSRAGATLLPVGLLAAWLVRPSTLDPRRLSQRTWLTIAVAVALVATTLGAAMMSGRLFAVNRLIVSHSPLDESRFAFAGPVLAVMWAGFPTGWGFGTFDPIYRVFEPDSALRLTYFNNAHDDLLELVLTGGLPAAVLLLVVLIWGIRHTAAAFGRGQYAHPSAGRPQIAQRARAAAMAIGIVLLASLVDYPLRTPLFGAVLAILCAFLGETDRSIYRLASQNDDL